MAVKAACFRGSGFSVSGRVFAGFREGRYFVSLPGYRKQIVEKLGFKPFPGTLNLRLSEKEWAEKSRKLKSAKPVDIRGFEYKGRVFGFVKCFLCLVRKPGSAASLRCYVVVPEKSKYGRNVVEVISSFNLRKELKLKNGSLVDVEVFV